MSEDGYIELTQQEYTYLKDGLSMWRNLTTEQYDIGFEIISHEWLDNHTEQVYRIPKCGPTAWDDLLAAAHLAGRVHGVSLFPEPHTYDDPALTECSCGSLVYRHIDEQRECVSCGKEHPSLRSNEEA